MSGFRGAMFKKLETFADAVAWMIMKGQSIDGKPIGSKKGIMKEKIVELPAVASDISSISSESSAPCKFFHWFLLYHLSISSNSTCYQYQHTATNACLEDTDRHSPTSCYILTGATCAPVLTCTTGVPVCAGIERHPINTL